MIFNTWTFGIFIAVFFAVYWLVLKPSWRPSGLLAGSLLFYTYYFPAYTILIGLLSVFVYGSGYFILKYREAHPGMKPRKPLAIMWFSVTVCVLVLGYYKYLRLLLSTFNDFLKLAGQNKSFAIPEILIPLGLSFFIFEFIHYLVDSYYGRTKQTSLLEFGVFALFFPTLVSGPIKRFQPFINQLRKGITFKPEFVTHGTYRIVVGLAKKILIADVASAYALPLTDFSKNPGISPFILWAAVYAYAVKIYFDFSGYSDIAIGCARLLGFEVPENFNKPYLRQNIAEFWRNWHMSLTSWLKDYIYMPIGKKLMPTVGKKSPFLLAAICQMITMGVSGLWHGASWNFVIWGLYHGFGMTVHRAFLDITTKIKRGRLNRENRKLHTDKRAPSVFPVSKFIKKPVYIFLTFQFVCIGWVFFVLDINEAVKVIYRLLFISSIRSLLGY